MGCLCNISIWWNIYKRTCMSYMYVHRYMLREIISIGCQPQSRAITRHVSIQYFSSHIIKFFFYSLDNVEKNVPSESRSDVYGKVFVISLVGGMTQGFGTKLSSNIVLKKCPCCIIWGFLINWFIQSSQEGVQLDIAFIWGFYRRLS